MTKRVQQVLINAVERCVEILNLSSVEQQTCILQCWMLNLFEQGTRTKCRQVFQFQVLCIFI